MWVSSTVSWANIEKYNTCAFQIGQEELLGRRCYVGCDLASRNDLASVCLEFPLDNGYYAVLHQSFMPEEKIYDNSRRDNVDYRAWINAGYIIATPGNVVDFDWIEEYIRNQAQKYEITEVCFDPWNATQMAAHLIDEGFNCVEVRQGYKSLSEPTKDLCGVIEDSKLVHFGDPVLRWAVGNVVSQSDENDNIRPSKAKSSSKIDPAMALIIAHTRAYSDAENYVNINANFENELREISSILGV